MNENGIHFMYADEAIKTRVLKERGEKAAHHMHISEGFSIIAMEGDMLGG